MSEFFTESGTVRFLKLVNQLILFHKILWHETCFLMIDISEDSPIFAVDLLKQEFCIMRKLFGISLFAAAAVLMVGPASAEMWNIDFDTGLDANGDEISFAANTIFSDRTGDNWQRYDGLSDGNTNPGNPPDGGIPDSNVAGDRIKVNIDVWTAQCQNGFTVGFDSTNQSSRDPDLEEHFTAVSSSLPYHTSQTNGYDNVLIIQSRENSDTRSCGGGLSGSGVCENNKADDEASGGDIVFEFDREVTLISMNFFDTEESGGKVKFAGADGIFDEWVTLPAIPDHGVGLLTFNGDIGIKAHKMMVRLAGSGAINNIMGETGTTSTVSEPGVLALFGIGLVAMGVYRRRRGAIEPAA